MEKLLSGAFFKRIYNQLGNLSTGCPVNCYTHFYQHMTDLVFRDLNIQSHFVGSSNDSTPEAAVSSHEAGALRYAAGYVCGYLCKKLNVRTTNLRRNLCFV